MSSELQQISLADICSDVSYGYTESASTEPIGPKFLRITDIQGGTFEWDRVPFCPASDADIQKYRLTVGDIVVARTGNSTGENAQVSKEPPAAVFASYLIRFRPDAKRVNPFFVGYQLRAARFRQYVLSVRSGSAQPGANAKQLGAYPIQLISRQLQNSTVEILRALDDRISLLRETNTTLEAIAQALFKSWFVDFDPVRAKQQGIAPQGIDAATAALFPDSFEESELGEVPKGWRVGTIGDIASVKGGFAYKSTEFCDAGFPVVKIKNIVGDGTVDLLDTQFIGSEIADKTNRFALKDGDVVMAMTGATIGKSGVIVTTGNQVSYLNQRVAKFEPSKQGHDNRWLVFVAFQNSVMSDQVVNAASGSAQPNISTSGIESVRLTIPSRIELLAVFCDYADTIFQSWMANQKQAQTLATLRDTLLPRLISGQLRLPV